MTRESFFVTNKINWFKNTSILGWKPEIGIWYWNVSYDRLVYHIFVVCTVIAATLSSLSAFVRFIVGNFVVPSIKMPLFHFGFFLL